MRAAVEQSGRFDVLHSHGYLWGIPLQRLSRAPMLHTLHVTPYEDEACLWSLEPEAHVSAISHYQWRDFPGLRPDGVVYHGVDPSAFSFRATPEDYLCYLGRFIPGKGPLAAISLARTLGIRLLLAGLRNDYYGEAIERHVDGRSVEYVGYASGVERDRLVGGARALLYLVQDPEPFGLVLVEAMMCGTPFAAVGLGAVPEIVDQGIAGCHAPNRQELDRVAPAVLGLPRARVRQQAIASLPGGWPATTRNFTRVWRARREAIGLRWASRSAQRASATPIRGTRKGKHGNRDRRGGSRCPGEHREGRPCNARVAVAARSGPPRPRRHFRGVPRSTGCRGGGALKSCDERPELRAYEVWTPMETFGWPLDITRVMHRKLRAVRCYASQPHSFRYDRAALGLSRYRGALAARSGCAEVFRYLAPIETANQGCKTRKTRCEFS